MKKIQEIMADAIVIDTHLDLLPDIEQKHRDGRTNVILDDYMDSFKKGHVDVIVSSIFVDSELLPELGLKRAMEQIAAFYQELDSCGGQFVLATTAKDILDARRQGKLAIMLAFEGAEPLNANPSLLRAFYALGVRILGLCWSRSNWAADGSRFFDFDYQGYGLTEGGRALVSLAQDLGMIIDVSHSNEKTFWDVVEMSTQPIIATHSCARALSDTPRNLSDEQIQAIGRLGGVIGVNGASLVARFKDPRSATPDDLAAHMLYEKKLAGAGILGIGLDQCDRLNSPTMQLEAFRDVFDIIPTHDGLDKLAAALLEQGLTEDELASALGGNTLRVFEKVLG